MTRTAWTKDNAVRVVPGLQRGLVHQAADGEVRQEQPIELLTDQVRGLAAQHDLRAAQVGLQFVERRLDLPALVVERGQLTRRAPDRDSGSSSPAR